LVAPPSQRPHEVEAAWDGGTGVAYSGGDDGGDAYAAVRTQAAPELRLGFRLIAGFQEAVAERLVRARRERPFVSVQDARDRALLTKRDLTLLAEAGAFDRLAGHRRQALWEAREPDAGPLFRQVVSEARVTEWLAPASKSEQLLLDFTRTGTSTQAHPMSLLRASLPPRTLDSKGLEREPHGSRVQIAGIVICRQRPMTASGVTFLTLEDEHGFINLVLWKTVAERDARAVTGSIALFVEGKVERDGAVLYVIVDRALAVKRTGSLPSMSRDFH
jgi:error-prone DNA polymerase